MSEKKILFIGVGNMGGAILSALTESNYSPDSIFFYEPDESKSKKISEQSKTRRVKTLAQGFSEADIVMLCIKPQIFFQVAEEICAELNTSRKKPVIISIMAGISIKALRNIFTDPFISIVRTMPNIAVTVKKGVVAIASDNLENDVLNSVELLFAPCALTVRVQEAQLNAVTGLSGSGPAFVFQFIEGLAMGGVKMGLPRETAMKLAVATVRGSSEMLMQSSQNTCELTANVSSPGGTTISGLQELETGAFRGIVMSAVEAAANRSAELGK